MTDETTRIPRVYPTAGYPHGMKKPSPGKYAVMTPAELSLHPDNPRKGDVPAIAASLRAHGQYKPIVVNVGTHTGRPHEVLAGNHTLKAFRDLAGRFPDDERWQNVDVRLVDVDDDLAARMVLADNRTSERGTMDDRLLAELLGKVAEQGVLDGTGYDQDDLTTLENLIANEPDLSEFKDFDESHGSNDKTPPRAKDVVCPACSHQFNPADSAELPASPDEAGDR